MMSLLVLTRSRKIDKLSRSPRKIGTRPARVALKHRETGPLVESPMDEKRERGQPKQIRAVARAAETLLALAAEREGLPLTRIADAVRLSKATTYRILATLMESGFVRYEPATKLYLLGRQLLRISNASNPYDELRRVARPHMQAVRDESGETVTLVVRQGMKRVTIDLLLGSHELKMVPEIGSTRPLYAGAAGKALLAHVPEEELARVIAGTKLAAVTPATITSPVIFKRELARVRARGFATSAEESMLGVAASAAPIFEQGRIVAALNVFGPKARLPAAKLEEIGTLAASAAAKISRKLGPRALQPPA